MYCKFCQKKCKNENSLRNHQRLCHSNPERQESNFVLYYNRIPWNKGLDKTDSRVAKNAASISKTTKGRPNKTIWTDEMRKAKSEWRKQLHIDHPETHPNRRLAGNRNKWTYPEKIAANWLDKNNIVYEYNKRVGRYYPDFIIGNIIIEIDGERFHNPEKDKIRDQDLSQLGYIVHRIKARERIEEELRKYFLEDNINKEYTNTSESEW